MRSIFGRKEKKPANSSSGADRRLVLSLSGKRMPSFKQLKHLPRYLSQKEATAIKTFAALIGLGLLAVGMKFSSEHVGRAPASGGEYAEAAVGVPRYANPVLASSNDADLDIVELVFSGLMRTDASGRIVPDLAASYDVSEDGKTYTVHLKEHVRWHDGAQFTSHDVESTVGFIKDPAWKSPLGALFKNVSVTAPDETTAVFTLSEPFAPFPSLLTVGIIPEHLWQDVKPENAPRAELNLKPIGTGPFRFKNFTKDKKGVIKSYTLVRNDDYYGEKPLLSSVMFKFYPDFAQAAQALTEKRVDGASFLPLELRDTVEKQRAVRLYTLRLPQYTAVFFNQKKSATLRSKNVRQALAYAVDRDAVLRGALADTGTPAYGPILPGFIGFTAEVKKYTMDRTAAAELLDKDGWKLGEDGFRYSETKDAKTKEVTKTPLVMTLTTADAKENLAVAEEIKKGWEAVGVKTEIDIVSASKIQKEKIRTRDYDALLYGEIVGSDPDPYPFWHSSQNENGGLNLTGFTNRRVDELLEKGRLTNKEEERTAYYKEFQDILAEESPAVFLYSPSYTYAVSRRVKGLGTTTIFAPSDRFTEIGKWYINTRYVWK